LLSSHLGPVRAEKLNAATAQHFVLGKLFAFACFDGSRGAGRVLATAQLLAPCSSAVRDRNYSVWLPAGTLKVKGETVYASLYGIPLNRALI